MEHSGNNHCHGKHNHCHEEHNHDHGKEENSLAKIIISAILFVSGMIFEHMPKLFSDIIVYDNVNANSLAKLVIFFLAYIIIARNVIKNAIRNIFKGEIFDEQFLMTVASLGAVCVGQLPEAVAVMLFYMIGEYFEDYAVDKSKDSIEALMEICPDTATVLKDGKEVKVKAEEVKIGETIIVKPGERVPVDGIITEGTTFMDTSALTGESVPVEATVGTEIYSGSINKNAVIQIKTTKLSKDSAASRILDLVSTSSEKKTKTERFITRFSRVYTPAVCALALAVAIIPPAITGLAKSDWQWSIWIYRALTFLVVSCPCAIVISVPLSFFGGIGAASKKGILLKGSSAIDALSRTKTAVFDKTGTLTKGIFVVTEICPASKNISEDELLTIAAHAENYSSHPVAASLKKAHSCPKCGNLILKNAQEIGGQGIKVTLEGKEILAGNAKLMEENNVAGFENAVAQEKAGTIIHLAQNGSYLGHIVISDETKEDAIPAIKSLKKLGIKKIVMLTGDNRKAAEKAAAQLGITEIHAQLLPEDKVKKVEELLDLNGKGTLCFAGDGINDAPVLARADIGIAMGALGSDAAIESADVVIMTDEPSKIAESISISRKTLAIVRQNIVFSLGIKAAIMILTGIGIGNMWLAVFADVGVSFLAILNSMRALGVTKLKK